MHKNSKSNAMPGPMGKGKDYMPEKLGCAPKGEMKAKAANKKKKK